VAELQRVGLFGSLSGEALARLAEETERIELAPGGAFGGGETTVDVLLTGGARSGAGMLRPGDVAAAAATAVTPCVVARMPRTAFDRALAGTG
jgi:hypothetical protein